MGDYDATLLGAVAQFGPIDPERLRVLYCDSEDPDTAEERSAKFDDRLRFLVNLGFVAVEDGAVTYLGSL